LNISIINEAYVLLMEVSAGAGRREGEIAQSVLLLGYRSDQQGKVLRFETEARVFLISRPTKMALQPNQPNILWVLLHFLESKTAGE
jgi:hypothetical protein